MQISGDDGDGTAFGDKDKMKHTQPLAFDLKKTYNYEHISLMHTAATKPLCFLYDIFKRWKCRM